MFALSFLLESTDVEPDLILLDLNMPFLTGWQFLDKLKENGLNYRVVILTSSINPMDKQKAEDYPLIDGFLIKPIEMEKLVEIREEIRKNNEQTKA
jgi:CheY-like chemotaxis protein